MGPSLAQTGSDMLSTSAHISLFRTSPTMCSNTEWLRGSFFHVPIRGGKQIFLELTAAEVAVSLYEQH